MSAFLAYFLVAAVVVAGWLGFFMLLEWLVGGSVE
jgi:hypothetical protein